MVEKVLLMRVKVIGLMLIASSDQQQVKTGTSVSTAARTAAGGYYGNQAVSTKYNCSQLIPTDDPQLIN